MKLLKSLVFIFLVITFAACTTPSNSQSVVSRVGSDEFEKLLHEEDVQLIDVRTKKEYDQAHLKGATLIDINQKDFVSKIETLDKSKKVLVYCAVGGRSNRAANVMKQLGFQEVYDLRNGIRGWIQSKKPVD